MKELIGRKHERAAKERGAAGGRDADSWRRFISGAVPVDVAALVTHYSHHGNLALDLEAAAEALEQVNVCICSWCGQHSPKTSEAMFQHATTCEKRPDQKLWLKVDQLLAAISPMLAYFKELRTVDDDNWIQHKDGGIDATTDFARAIDKLIAAAEEAIR